MRHWINPWDEARDVLVEDIIDIASRANQYWPPTQRAEDLRNWVGKYGSKVDGYIIPSPSGWHALGVRYGNEGYEYLSFTVDKGPELDALLAKSTSAP
jgi:hypothetical protein